MSKQKLPRSEEIAKRVRTARKEAGDARGRKLTQKELASKADITEQTVWRAENTGCLSPKNAKRIGECLGVSPKWLLAESPYKTDSESLDGIKGQSKKRLEAITALLESYGYTIEEVPGVSLNVGGVTDRKYIEKEGFPYGHDQNYKIFEVKQTYSLTPSNRTTFDLSLNGSYIRSGLIDEYALETFAKAFFASVSQAVWDCRTKRVGN